MNYVLCVIFDKVTGIYGDPFLSVNQAAAVRRFNTIMQASPMVSLDCQLFKTGEYNSASGVITSFPVLEFITSYQPCEVK